jgi:hypothetical protein
MTFTTETGSVYEVDTEAKRIRRLTGEGKPTERVGDVWRDYSDITTVALGYRVLVTWTKDVPLLDTTPAGCGFVPSTLTSKVVSTSELN